MRLAFAIGVHVDTDILLVDEVFSVGDDWAQRKCIDKMFELKKSGRAIIFVSHDLGLLKRICSRGIFLRDGKIIKDSFINDACNYYIETVGEKSGITIAQKGRLGIVFNNGKLIIRWNNENITCGSSGHSLMISSEKQYLSYLASWTITAVGDNKIVATGRWPGLAVTQEWEITINEENEFNWEITSHVLEEIPVERFQTTIFLSDGYKQWFTPESEADFPEDFTNVKEWDFSQVNEPKNKTIGLKTVPAMMDKYPTIIFDRQEENLNIICQIGNTGSEFQARVLTYELLAGNSKSRYLKRSYKCFSSKIKIFDGQKDGLLSYLDSVKQLARNPIVIRKNCLSIVSKNNSIVIFWYDKMISGLDGLNTTFKCMDRDHSSSEGRWEIYKENSDELRIIISWDAKLPFRQTWKLKIIDNAILWEVDMEIDEKTRIRNKEMKLRLNPDYSSWLAAEDSGSFDHLNNKGSVVLKRHINKFIGVDSILDNQSVILSRVLFKDNDLIPKISYILKEKEGIPHVELRYQEIDCKENFYYLPGKYVYFKGKIEISPKASGQEILAEDGSESRRLLKTVDQKNNLEQGRLKFIFDQGKGMFFWNNNELTKGLGMYFAVFFRDNWYDSTQAYWKVNRLNQKDIVAIGSWAGLPLTQTWEISMPDEQTIYWNIIEETWDNVVIDKTEANIMLSERYNEWSGHDKVWAKFAEGFNKHNGYAWDKVWRGSEETSGKLREHSLSNMVTGKDPLPQIQFNRTKSFYSCLPGIENTDNLFKARIIQHSFNLHAAAQSSPNKVEYFSGVIKLYTQK